MCVYECICVWVCACYNCPVKVRGQLWGMFSPAIHHEGPRTELNVFTDEVNFSQAACPWIFLEIQSANLCIFSWEI